MIEYSSCIIAFQRSVLSYICGIEVEILYISFIPMSIQSVSITSKFKERERGEGGGRVSHITIMAVKYKIDKANQKFSEVLIIAVESEFFRTAL